MKTVAIALCMLPMASGFAFVQKSSNGGIPTMTSRFPQKSPVARKNSSSMQMLDEAVIKGAAVAFLGLAAGVGMVAFTESAGERAKVRGSGLSDGMTTRITGQLMEDVEVSSVADLGSLTEQLEAALKETGGADAMDLKMTEEEKKRIAEELEDGW